MKTTFIPIKKADSKLLFDRAGVYVVYFSNISGSVSCTIAAEQVQLYMLGLYDMRHTEKYKIHTEQIHQSPHSFSDLYVLSVAHDNSSLSFAGRILIQKDAQQSHAYQKNQNLILSPNAFVDSQPILEILADDVFCTHGSTSGPLSPDQLQYLQVRGLNRHEAAAALVEGFKQQVYDRLVKLGVKSYARS